MKIQFVNLNVIMVIVMIHINVIVGLIGRENYVMIQFVILSVLMVIVLLQTGVCVSLVGLDHYVIKNVKIYQLALI